MSNANDNHWLTNVNAPLEGAMLFGEERTPRTPRTRMNHQSSWTASSMDIELLKAASFGSRSILEEDLRTAVVERCENTSTVLVELEEEEHTVDRRELVLFSKAGMEPARST